MTLRELKKLIKSTKGIKTPGPKALRESGVPVVASCLSQGSILIVYENGFAIYQRDGRGTVLSVDDCRDYTYFSVTGEICLSEEYFLEQDFHLLLSLVAEDRLIHNLNKTSDDHEVSYSDQEKEWGAMKDERQDVLGTIILEETLRETYGCMTERQAEILKMYYLEQMTIREIAEELGISHQGVKKSLDLAIANAQKNLKNF